MSDRQLPRDITINLIFAIVNLVSIFYLIRLVNLSMSVYWMGVFLLARRLISAGANLFQLGTSQTILRYISIHSEEASNKIKYLSVAFFIWVLLSILVLLGAWSILPILAKVAFPKVSGAGELALGSCFLMLMTMGHFIFYSTLLAERRFFIGNFFEWLGNSGCLIALILFSPIILMPFNLIRAQAVCIGVVSAFGIIVMMIFYKTACQKEESSTTVPFKEIARHYATYGIPRAGITFLDMLLLTVGPWELRNDPKQAGYLIIALTLLRAVQACMLPISQVISVVIARQLNKDKNNIENMVRSLTGLFLYVASFATVFFYFWGHEVLKIWLGTNSADKSSLLLNILLFSLVPYSLYNGLKGAISVQWYKPFNLVSLSVGIMTFFLVCQVLEYYLPISLAVSYAILTMLSAVGVCSVWKVRKYLHGLASCRAILFYIAICISAALLTYYFSISETVVSLVLNLLTVLLLFLGVLALSQREAIKRVCRL